MPRGAVWLLALLVAARASALEVPALRAHVNDLAGLLPPDAAGALERELADYEQGTGHSFALLVIPSLEGEVLEDFSMRVAEAWKLGSAARDDGLLLLIALAERRTRIEVGHGLEGAVTDALAARVLRSTLAPALAAGRAEAGVRETFSELMRAAQGESTGPAERPSPAPMGLAALFWLALLLLVLRQIEQERRQALRHRRSTRRHVWIGPAGWGGGLGGYPHGRTGGGGIGWGRGGFGGGGGSFGGGGASGRW